MCRRWRCQSWNRYPCKEPKARVRSSRLPEVSERMESTLRWLAVGLLTVVLGAVLVSACGQGAGHVQHPLPDSLASAFHPYLLSDPQRTPPGLEVGFVRGSLLATYGPQDLPEADIIGRIGIAKLWQDDVFVLDDRLHTVHVLGVGGASHEQVGGPGQGPGELAIPRGLALSHDRLYVGDERRVIHEYAWVPTRMNEVHMYGTDGALRWIARLPGYKPMAMIEDTISRTVSMGLADDRTEMHMLYAATPVDSNLLVQLSLYDQRAVEEDTPRAIESYLIDLNSGVARKVAFPYSGVIGVTDTRIALFTNDPWPRVDVFVVSGAR